MWECEKWWKKIKWTQIEKIHYWKKKLLNLHWKKNVSPINVDIFRTNQLKFIELWNYLLPDYTHVTTSIQYVIKGD